jgi:hypothetical protein
MDRPIDDLTIEQEVDAALEQARSAPEPLRIVEAVYHRTLDLFELKISNGRRLVFARENLQPLASAAPEQAADFTTKPNGRHIWWPKLDEGLSLAGLLEGRTGNDKWMERLRRLEVAA